MVCTTDPIGFFGDCCDRPPPEPLFCGWSHITVGNGSVPLTANGQICFLYFNRKALLDVDKNPLAGAWNDAITDHNNNLTDCTDPSNWRSVEWPSHPVVASSSGLASTVNCPHPGSGAFGISGSGGTAGQVFASYDPDGGSAVAQSTSLMMAQLIPISTGPNIRTEHGIHTIRVTTSIDRTNDITLPDGWAGSHSQEISFDCRDVASGLPNATYCSTGNIAQGGTMEYVYGSVVNDCADVLTEILNGTAINESSWTEILNPASTTATSLTAVTTHLAGGSDTHVYWAIKASTECYNGGFPAYPGNPSGDIVGHFGRIQAFTSSQVRKVEWLDSGASVIREWTF